MIRVLLATEGPSDEVIAESLIRQIDATASIECKAFPARGLHSVRRLMNVVVRAAHFGHYDLLVVHFDLDETLATDFANVSESERWQEINAQIDATLSQLPSADRPAALRWSLMTPCQAMEAWMAWGRDNKDGRQWERKSRHQLKDDLFGSPPRKVLEKSQQLAGSLVSQMNTSDHWPRSLRNFVDSLNGVLDE